MSRKRHGPQETCARPRQAEARLSRDGKCLLYYITACLLPIVDEVGTFTWPPVEQLRTLLRAIDSG